MANPISNADFGHLFESFERSAFRLESLDQYSVAEEAVDYQRFLNGEELPTSTDNGWAQFVKNSIAHGKIIQRVHVVPTPLTPYLKYEIEWGYVYNSVAGEEIYLIERTKVPSDILRMPDFWLFDNKTLALMRYDSAGRFLNAEIEDSEAIISACGEKGNSLLSRATPLKKYLARLRAT